MAKPAVDCSSTRCVNTAVSWEICGRFSVDFYRNAKLFVLRGRAGVTLRGASAEFASARIIQSYDKDYVKVYVDSDPVPIKFPHNVVRAIWDEDGVVWHNPALRGEELHLQREARK